MKYLEIRDKNQWDTLITSEFDSSFFQSWNWGEFQKKMGKEVIRIGFFDGDKNFAAAQGIVINAKRGKYLYVRNGPVAGWKSQIQNDFIISSLKEIAKQKGLWFIRISPLVETDSEKSILLKKMNFPVSPMYDVDALDTWILDITQTEEEMLEQMRKSTRYEIRKARKEGVEIVIDKEGKYIDEFYEIYLDTVKRQKWIGYTKEFIKTQFDEFKKDSSIRLYLAKYQGKFISASIFVYYGDSTYYHYSGSLTEFKKIPGTSLIHWENIKYSKSIGKKKYNFWGITPENKPNHPWHGLSFYKKGFGGYEKRWLKTQDIPISPLYWITNIFEKFDKWKKGY